MFMFVLNEETVVQLLLFNTSWNWFQMNHFSTTYIFPLFYIEKVKCSYPSYDHQKWTHLIRNTAVAGAQLFANTGLHAERGEMANLEFLCWRLGKQTRMHQRKILTYKLQYRLKAQCFLSMCRVEPWRGRGILFLELFSL